MGSDAIRPGDVIGGRYRVGPILSRSRGLLFEGVHTDFEQRVVIRVLPASLCEPKEVRRFQREARILTRLESEHVARLLDVGTLPSGALFYVRPYLDGASLDGYLKLRGALPLEEATLLILQAAEAVAESHVHHYILRELSPSALFLTRRVGGEPLIKVIDFGTAKLMRDATAVGGGEFTATSMFGLSCYSSPEVVRKLPAIDGRADIWSLGAIFYHMLAGRLPFDGEMAILMLQICREKLTPIAEARADLPPEIGQIIEWSMAKEADARFPNVYGFARALAPFASSEGMLLIQRIGTMSSAAEQRRSTVSSIPPELPLVHGNDPPREQGKASGDRDSSPTLIRDVESMVRAKRARDASAEALRASAPEPFAATPTEDKPAPVEDRPAPVEDMLAPLEDMLRPPEEALAPVENLRMPAADIPTPMAIPAEPPTFPVDPLGATHTATTRDSLSEERVLIDLSLVGAPPSSRREDERYGSTPSGSIGSQPELSAAAWSREPAGGAVASAVAADQSHPSWGASSPAAFPGSPQKPELHHGGSAPLAAGRELMAPPSIPKSPPVPPLPPRVRPQVKEVRMARAAFAGALVVLLGALGYAFFRGYGKSDRPTTATAPSATASELASAPELSAPLPQAAASTGEPSSPSSQPLPTDAADAASSTESAGTAASALPTDAHPFGSAPPTSLTARPWPAGVSTGPSTATASSPTTASPTAAPAVTGSSAGSVESEPTRPAEEHAPLVTAQPVDSSEMGTLIAVAVGGSCTFSVNDAERGTMSTLKSQMKAGTYVVTCKPAAGAAQSKTINIPKGGVGMATFKVQ